MCRRVQCSCNDGGGRGNGGVAIDGGSDRDNSPACRVHRTRGSARGQVVSGSKGQCAQRHRNEYNDLHQIKEAVK